MTTLFWSCKKTGDDLMAEVLAKINAKLAKPKALCLKKVVPGTRPKLPPGLQPVPGASFDALDWRRLHEYLARVLAGDAPRENDREEWEQLLYNLELMTDSAGERVATVDGILLFGKRPSRYLPQSGVRAICYAGAEPDYATRADETCAGP